MTNLCKHVTCLWKNKISIIQMQHNMYVRMWHLYIWMWHLIVRITKIIFVCRSLISHFNNVAYLCKNWTMPHLFVRIWQLFLGTWHLYVGIRHLYVRMWYFFKLLDFIFWWVKVSNVVRYWTQRLLKPVIEINIFSTVMKTVLK